MKAFLVGLLGMLSPTITMIRRKLKELFKAGILLIIAFILIVAVSCATPRGDAQKVYTLSITGVCLAPGCTITHTVKIEIKADVKKDQKAEATSKVEATVKATGL